LFSEIEKLKGAFESVERPTLVKHVQTPSSPKDAPKDTPKSPVRPEEKQDPDSKFAKLELEFEKVNKYPMETSDWDFDELEAGS
jgi:hypothetical protein